MNFVEGCNYSPTMLVLTYVGGRLGVSSTPFLLFGECCVEDSIVFYYLGFWNCLLFSFQIQIVVTKPTRDETKEIKILKPNFVAVVDVSSRVKMVCL